MKNVAGGVTRSQYDYAYDALGRRTSVANSGSAFSQAAFNKWNYNDRNELIESGRFLGTNVTQTNSPVAGEYRAYDFDAIGNRKTATEGSAQKTYNANAVNEYVTAGSANLTYDLDGNLTSDGTRRFVYDAENRLTLVEPVAAVDGSTRVRMAYDYLGRRVQKVVEEFDGSSWAAADDVRFVYMGWNVIEERKTSGGVTTKKNFVWGLDLSQSMDGAGGIGGLLAVVDQAGTQMAFLYDANGNVGQLVDEQGAVVARYEYDAFGNVLVAAGAAAEGNAYRFSTKYADQETGLVYYGMRFYDAGLGRWTQRDPAEEDVGGLNLHAFVWNDPASRFDAFGLNPDSVEDVVRQLQEAANKNGVNFARVRLWAASTFTEGPPFVVLGNAIHTAVFNDYESKLPGEGIFDAPVDTTLLRIGASGSAGGEGWLRPDIFNRRSRELYEVKSIRGAWIAIEEVADYIEVFRKAGVCVGAGRRGPETDGLKAWPSGLQVEWHWAQPGVILYEFTNLPRPELLPVPIPARRVQDVPQVNNRTLPPGAQTIPWWILAAAAAGSLFSPGH